MLLAVCEKVSQLFPLAHSVYNAPSSFIQDKTIQPVEGVQQGDSLGPLLFFLTTMDLMTLRLELLIFYLDAGTLVGEFEDVLGVTCNVLTDLRFL